ncbi:alpha/beta fold hydrolase [Paenibacillus sp. LMG 31456]|uniref:Alpha/beta fold hydrolase n=1 Tax=Paenibacillus foliorum TaxID=2654974 RepID=A0A972JZ42_9BACL|nr:alpha/beta hydrolase [Paenibacillus foliorum]NOU93216.1 alpha/beta fold hydrolase [Paenibacillus foliorum]
MMNSLVPIGIRKYFESGDMKLSYLDFGREGQKILLLLHGHMGNAREFSKLASKFDDWRVIALDQRGHGWSEHPPEKDYSRESYITDIYNLIHQELGGASVSILGHSLGGVNAYQFAARYPELVNAVIVEDIGVELNHDISFVAKLPERSASLQQLKEELDLVGLKAINYFSESAFEDEKGWGLRFDLKGMVISTQSINGIRWEEWLASTCPILLVHGKKSWALKLEEAERMVSRRPHTKLEVFEECGHGVHSDDLNGFYQVVKNFFDGLHFN